jgi:hypothetical protein
VDGMDDPLVKPEPLQSQQRPSLLLFSYSSNNPITIKHTPQMAEKRKARLAEAGGGISARLCRICKVKIDPQRHYCNDCSYKKVRGGEERRAGLHACRDGCGLM